MSAPLPPSAPEPLFSQEVWRRAEPVLEAVHAHPFLRSLLDGTLPRERFDTYMAHDAVYLGRYGRALARLASMTNDPDELILWDDAARTAIVTERVLHADHVDVAAAVEPSPTCLAYTDFIDAAALSGSYGVAVAAVLPCFLVYEAVGLRLLDEAGDLTGHPYGDWIATYGDEAFSESCSRARAVMDAAAARAGAAERDAMSATFLRACRYEWMFWDAAWRAESWPV